MKKSTRLLLWLSLLGVLLFFAAATAVALLIWDHEAPASGPRALVIQLEDGIPDAPPQGAFVLDKQDFPPMLTEITRAIRYASDDDSIDSLVLDIQPLSLGWGSIQELVDAVHFFTGNGKPCLAYSDSLTNKEYLLAASCGEIALAPAGMFLVNGLSVSTTYFAGAMEKLGIESNLQHVGDYKSAVEPYERTGPSDAAREATDSLLDSVYANFLSSIAMGRSMDLQQVEYLVDQAHMTPDMALQDGLVDELAFRKEFIEDFAGEDPITLGRYLKKVRKAENKRPWIAVIYTEGTIVSGEGSDDLWGSSYVGDRAVIRMLEDVRMDDEIPAVVLRVNSPGGSGLASDNIWAAVQRLRQEKPLVVSMGDMAASGGYYISMGADAIFAQPTTLTGSIGVFGGKMNMAGLYAKLGLTTYQYKRGRNSDILSYTNDFSDEGRARFREFLESFYDLFLSRAAEGRSMTRADIHRLARGRVWTGSQAMENGLVDQLGSLDDAIEKARQLAGVREPTGILRLPEQMTFFDTLLNDLSNPGDDEEVVARLLSLLSAGQRQAIQNLAVLDRVLQRGGVAAMLPVDITIR